MNGPEDWIELGEPERSVIPPLLSVLMLAYNHGPYLADAVDGVLMQRTDFPIELVIGEDCSPDDTREVALRQQLRSPGQIRIITANRNVGAQANFRRIFRASRGEFVAICEGDDYWVDPDKLQRQVDLLRSRPDVTAVFTNFRMSRWRRGRWQLDAATALAPGDVAALRGDLRANVAQAGTLRTLTSVYRSTVIAALYERKLRFADYPFLDGFMLAEAISRGNIECLDSVSAVYRMSPNSATRSGTKSGLRVLRSVREFYGNLHVYFPELPPVAASVLHHLDARICDVASLAGEAETFEEAYQRMRESGSAIPARLPVLRWIVGRRHLRRILVKLRSLARWVLGAKD